MIRKKRQKSKQPEKKSRAKYNRPDETGKLIDYVNDVPSNIPLASSREIELGHQFAPALDSTGAERETRFVAHSKELFDECFFAFSEKYKNELLAEIKDRLLKTNPGIGERHISHRVIAMALRQYDDIVAKREILIDIANYFAALRKDNNSSENNDAIQTEDEEYLPLPGIYVQIGSEGTIGKVAIGLAAAFHNVDLDRIRICEICSKIFWAKREDSETCSAKCFGVLRTRRYRNLTVEEKAEREAKREANRERNKKLKQLKEKKNGTL